MSRVELYVGDAKWKLSTILFVDDTLIAVNEYRNSILFVMHFIRK